MIFLHRQSLSEVIEHRVGFVSKLVWDVPRIHGWKCRNFIPPAAPIKMGLHERID